MNGRPPDEEPAVLLSLSAPMQRLQADLRSADARLARAIALLARAEKTMPTGACRSGRALYAAQRRVRAAEAAEVRAGAAVSAVVERIARTRGRGYPDLAFKLQLLARIAGVDYLPVANEPLDRRLLRSLLADGQRLHERS